MASYALLLQEVLGLLAYVDPTHSPLKHLLDQSHRELVADTLNAAILGIICDASARLLNLWALIDLIIYRVAEADMCGRHAPLETLLRHLLATTEATLDLSSHLGEAFKLER